MSLLANIPMGFLDEFQTSTYIHVSSATLLVTDWFFTLELEATYAWNPPWNMGTVLFFLTRYLVFADTFISLHRQLTPAVAVDACALLYTVEGWLISFGIIIAELILTIRVWAIWERSQKIKIFLVVISAVTASAGSVGYILYGTEFFRSNPTLTVPGCFIGRASTALQWAYAALLVHQTIISAMTVVKGVHHYRIGSYSTSLILTFYEDGVSYYVVMIGLSVVNIVMLHENSVLLISIQRVLHSLLTARMLLNLRQEAVTLYVGGQSHNALAFISDTVDGGTVDERKGSNSTPRKRQSRVEGWFGKQHSLGHQRSIWMDVEKQMWACKNIYAERQLGI